MHPSRLAIRSGACHRGGRAARCGVVPHHSRGLAHWSPFVPAFGRFSPPSDIAPFSRFFNDPFFRGFDNFFPGFLEAADTRPEPFRQIYQPRFDIRDVDNAYELEGEIPGVRNEDLIVEFTDPQTLIIKGRAVREADSSAPLVATNAGTAPTSNSVAAENDNASDTASVLSSSSYQKPSVEDVEPEQAESSTVGAATPTTSVAESEKPNEIPVQTQQEKQNNQYWVSERFYGEFQRRFTFPVPVDQENVRASLQDGILSISVPKVVTPRARRINIE